MNSEGPAGGHWSRVIGQWASTMKLDDVFRFQISDFRKSIPKPRYPHEPIREIGVIRGKNRFILLAIFRNFRVFRGRVTVSQHTPRARRAEPATKRCRATRTPDQAIREI